MGVTRVGDVACGRAGDKGATLDLSLVAAGAAAYDVLVARLDAETVARRLGAPRATRYLLPELLALKFVLPGALDAGPWASRRAGVHWQKAAISALLAMDLSEPPTAVGPDVAREPLSPRFEDT